MYNSIPKHEILSDNFYKTWISIVQTTKLREIKEDLNKWREIPRL